MKHVSLTQRRVGHVAGDDIIVDSHQVQAGHAVGHAARELGIPTAKVSDPGSRRQAGHPGYGTLQWLLGPPPDLLLKALRMTSKSETSL